MWLLDRIYLITTKTGSLIAIALSNISIAMNTNITFIRKGQIYTKNLPKQPKNRQGFPDKIEPKKECYIKKHPLQIPTAHKTKKDSAVFPP